MTPPAGHRQGGLELDGRLEVDLGEQRPGAAGAVVGDLVADPPALAGRALTGGFPDDTHLDGAGNGAGGERLRAAGALAGGRDRAGGRGEGGDGGGGGARG